MSAYTGHSGLAHLGLRLGRRTSVRQPALWCIHSHPLPAVRGEGRGADAVPNSEKRTAEFHKTKLRYKSAGIAKAAMYAP